jgi:hypothetical protein
MRRSADWRPAIGKPGLLRTGKGSRNNRHTPGDFPIFGDSHSLDFWRDYSG